MPKIIIHQEKISNPEKIRTLCPFGAIEISDGKASINEACKFCKICINKGPAGAFEFQEDIKPQINKNLWKGIAVYIEHFHGKIHPVSYELIGKAREMAEKIKCPVYALIIGYNIREKAEQLLEWGVDEAFSYDFKELEDFLIESYTNVFCDFVNREKPSVVLVGGTHLGRSLAPRTAAALKTGLTADCTVLDIQSNSDMDQIRPAFGGNIMAHIRTPNHRPQFATVRYKIFPLPEKLTKPESKVTICDIDRNKLGSRVKILSTLPKQKSVNIEESDILVAVGRGFKRKEDLDLAKELAEILDGQLASTRPLTESGWIEPIKQIGLSGRTVKPKLIIACGISGSIQFRAGMENSEVIVAINKDKNAPVFNFAHYGIIGDIYEIIPELIEKIKQYKQNKTL